MAGKNTGREWDCCGIQNKQLQATGTSTSLKSTVSVLNLYRKEYKTLSISQELKFGSTNGQIRGCFGLISKDEISNPWPCSFHIQNRYQAGSELQEISLIVGSATFLQEVFCSGKYASY